MPLYYSNVELSVSDVSGLTWETMDDAGTSASFGLNAGCKVHDIGSGSTVSCVMSKIDTFKSKMTFTVTGAAFTKASISEHLNKVWDVGSSDIVESDVSVTTGSDDAITQTIRRTYTVNGSTATTLTPYAEISSAFTAESINAFKNDVMDKTVTGLAANFKEYTGDIFMDRQDGTIEYYSNRECTTKVNDSGDKFLNFIMHMIQMHNDMSAEASLDLDQKLLDTSMLTSGYDEAFGLFSGHHLIVAANVATKSGFETSPGKFGVRIYFN